MQKIPGNAKQHGAKMAEVYGIVGYLLSIIAFCKVLFIIFLAFCTCSLTYYYGQYCIFSGHTLQNGYCTV